MIKKIAFITFEVDMLFAIEKNESIEIALLVLPQENIEQVQHFRCLKNAKIVSIESFSQLEIAKNFNFNLIEKYRKTQLKVDYLYKRFSSSDIGSQDYYYKSLFFWDNIFEIIKFDFIFIDSIEHGYPFDSIPIDMAKDRNIPVYNKITVSNAWVKIYNNTDDALLICPNTNIVKSESKGIFIKNKVKYNLRKDYLKFLFLLKDVFLKKRITGSIWGVEYPQLRILYNYIYTKILYFYYKKYAVKFTREKKYIYFALHFEPEAITGISTEVRSQCLFIEILSKIVPDDVTIFVKEHPDQFNIDYETGWYFYISQSQYKNIDFYKRLKKMRNVKLLDINTPTKEILTHASAVASIVGTVLLEGVMLNKPCLQFSKRASIFQECSHVFKITSFEECADAIQKIFSNNANSTDQKKDSITKFLFGKTDSDNRTIIDCILNDIKK